MTSLRLQNRRERALLIEGVLDDPRWEKLAEGKAKPEEIADLKAWAQQSKMAQKAWEIFQPPTEAEFEIRAVELARTLVHREVGQRRDRLDQTNLFCGNRQRGDRRMMAKHQARLPQSDPLCSPTLKQRNSAAVRLVHTSKDENVRVVPSLEKQSAVVPERRTATAPVAKRAGPIIVESFPSDSSGNTSRRIALVRETTNPTPAPMASTRVGGWAHQFKQWGSFQPWFGALLLCLSFATFVGIIVWKDKAFRNNRIVALAEPVSPPQTPVVPDSFQSSTELFEPSPEMRASFQVPNDGSAPAMSSTKNAPEAPSAKPRALAPQASSPRSFKKAPIDNTKNCTGFGVFKRCQ